MVASVTLGFFNDAPGATFICKKEVPKITLRNLSPPYKDYSYFQFRQIFPFEYNASSFSLINAWWLAEISTLVYADETYVRAQFTQAGLKHIRFLNRSSTQCFIAANNRYAIIAFRGSEIWKRGESFNPRRIVADLKTDIDIRLSEWVPGGRVHSGFKAALEDVWDELLQETERLQDQGIKIWITGHSLGAALATLAADRLQTVQGLYTFGSPRVGDRTFESRFRPKAFRIVNGNDIFASLPPAGSFRHVGELRWITPKTGPDDGHGEWELAIQGPCGEASDASEGGDLGSVLWVPSAIRDHVPLFYAIFLWNELVETMKKRD